MRCAGKYLRGSGLEDGLIECVDIGSKIIEQVFSGSHYYRSFFGLSVIEDAVTHLKMEAFWKHHDPSEFADAITVVKRLRSSLISKYDKLAKTTFKDVNQNKKIRELLSAINEFTEKCSTDSEMCRYLENYIKIIGTIKQLIRSDREANFLQHIKIVGGLCTIFTGGDGVNYKRCCSFYHEVIKNLKNNHPSVYLEFMQGNFVVKTCDGEFNSVAADMKLEQTIQRSSKSSHGIIGNTRSYDYTTEWCLIYHEIIGIRNAFKRQFL